MKMFPLTSLIAMTLSFAASLPAQGKTVDTKTGPVSVEVLASDLNHPWGMAFLSDGRLLITERAGNLRTFTKGGELSEPLTGVPKVLAEDQGGLLDIALDPQFESNQLVYLSFAEPGEAGASTALGRGRLNENRIEDFKVIFRQEPKVSGAKHFGGRIVFSPKDDLFLTTGERFKFEPAQDLSSDLGKVIRIKSDGSIPEDNPFVGQDSARPEIWSYGHRNIEGAAIHPKTGALWVAEMGPKGGDELNISEPGKNYGWPVVSWGRHYDGRDIPDPPTHPEFVDAIRQWTPVISPSGMIFYAGDAFPAWKGNVLIGSLSRHGLVRLEVGEREVRNEEIIPIGTRIRDVEQGPDGAVYLLTDERRGSLLRLTPQQ